MFLIPARYRRSDPVNPELIDRFREVAGRFIERAPLSESSLIFDGPGLGCPTQILLLSLLGYQRFRELGAIHSFSASSYATLFFLAMHQGQFISDEMDVRLLVRENQRRHGIVPFWTLLRKTILKVMGQEYPFPGELTEAMLQYSASEEFCCLKVSQLPENLFFWTYNETRREFCKIHSESDLKDLTLSQLIRAATSVAQIYSPLSYQGSIYSDAMSWPGVRDIFHELRDQRQNCLFLHMNWQGEKDQTIYLKAHTSGSRRQRVFTDFLYFYLGLDIPEVADITRKGLFKIKPLAMNDKGNSTQASSFTLDKKTGCTD